VKRFAAGLVAGLVMSIPAAAFAASKPPQHVVVKDVLSKKTYTETLFVTIGKTRYKCVNPDTNYGSTKTNLTNSWAKAKCPVG
jgi:hypothetical protein